MYTSQVILIFNKSHLPSIAHNCVHHYCMIHFALAITSYYDGHIIQKRLMYKLTQQVRIFTALCSVSYLQGTYNTLGILRRLALLQYASRMYNCAERKAPVRILETARK